MQTQTHIFAPEQPHDMNNYYFDWKHIETSLTHKNKLFKYSTPILLFWRICDYSADGMINDSKPLWKITIHKHAGWLKPIFFSCSMRQAAATWNFISLR